MPGAISSFRLAPLTPSRRWLLGVGHSNTAPALLAELAGQLVPPLGEAEYGRLFVLVLPPDGPATLAERRY